MAKKNCRKGCGTGTLIPLSFSTICFLSLVVFSSGIQTASAWNWKIFGEEKTDTITRKPYEGNKQGIREHTTDFDTEGLDNPKGRELVQRVLSMRKREEDDTNMSGSSCWQSAYAQIFSNCKQIMENEHLKSRLAFLLSDCFVKESGRPPLPYCSPKTPINDCLRALNDHNHKIYLSFFIDSHAMCHHLQSQAFKIETEKVINNLKTSSSLAVEKLWKIEEKSDELLDQSDSIQESLGFVKSKTEFIAQTSKEAEEKISNVMSRSDVIFQQSNEIIDAQSKLREEQSRMRENIDKNMGELEESYKTLEENIGTLQTFTEDAHLKMQENVEKRTVEIQNSYSELADGVGILQSLTQEAHLKMEKEIQNSMIEIQKSYLVLGETVGSLQNMAVETHSTLNDVAIRMSSQLDRIHSKADDIGNGVTSSLEQQKELLSGQSLALQGLDGLSQAQVEAFEQSRLSLQRLADDARRNQLEIMSYQNKLLETHSRLAKSSNDMLLAQESFESKQTNMLMALDKLFSLYNSALMESRTMKAFFFYLGMALVAYMLTSTKQTNHVRACLYFGLCTSFGIECLFMRFYGNNMSDQGWITSRIFYIRLTYIIAALLYFIYSLFRYRDYERLNYKLLLDIHEKLIFFDPSMDENGSFLFREKLLTCGAERRSNVRRSQGRSCESFLDANFEDEISDNDPDYYPSSSEDE